MECFNPFFCIHLYILSNINNGLGKLGVFTLNSKTKRVNSVEKSYV